MSASLRLFGRALARTAAVAVTGLAVLPACSETPEKSAAGKVETPDVQDTSAQVDAAPAGPQVVTQAVQGAGPYVEILGAWLSGPEAGSLGRVKVEVYVGGFTSLFGIAGHLRYDPAVLELVDFQTHPVPAAEDSQWFTRTMGKPSPAGRILLGSARFRTNPKPYQELKDVAVVRDRWVTAEFKVLQKAAATIAFDPASQVARTAEGKDVPGTWGDLKITWAGGQP